VAHNTHLILLRYRMAAARNCTYGPSSPERPLSVPPLLPAFRRLSQTSDVRCHLDRLLHGLQLSIRDGYGCRFRILRNAFRAVPHSTWATRNAPKRSAIFKIFPPWPIANLFQSLEDDFRQARASRRTDVGLVSSSFQLCWGSIAG
jgi:hypothetical protein